MIKLQEYRFEYFYIKKTNFFLLIITIASFLFTFSLLCQEKQLQIIKGIGVLLEENKIEVQVTNQSIEKVQKQRKIKIERTTFTYKVLDIQEETGIMILELDKKIDNNFFSYQIELDTKNIGSILWSRWKGEE